MKKMLIIIVSLASILSSSFGAPIYQGLRGSDSQIIRLTPKKRKLTKREAMIEKKQMEERARIFKSMMENRYQTYYDPRTGVMFQSTPANMRTPYQSWLYGQLKNKKVTTPKNAQSK